MLEAAQKHHARGLQEQAQALCHLMRYKKLRIEEIDGSHAFRRNALIKEIYQECAEALGLPVKHVRRQMETVEALSEKLPETYALYQRGEADLISVQKINRAIEGISHRPELMEKLDGELSAKARELNSAELGHWLNQRVPELDVKAYEDRYERAKHKHYVSFEPQGDGTTKFHGLISTVAAARIEQMLYSMARNKPGKAATTGDGEPAEERTHTQRMADIFTSALTNGLQGGSTGATDSQGQVASSEGVQLPLLEPGSLGETASATESTTFTGETPVGSLPGPIGVGAANIGVLIPVKTLTGESDDPAISWDQTWMLPASEARAIAADASVKHEWYAVGVAKDANTAAGTGDETSTGVGEVLTVTKTRTAPASISAEDIDQWISKTDPGAQNLLTKTYESRTARSHQRNAVLIRDGQCQTAGCTEPGWSAEIDHKQSYETGGTTTGENLQALCKACHDIKSHKHHPPDGVATEWELGPPPDWAVEDAA